MVDELSVVTSEYKRQFIEDIIKVIDNFLVNSSGTFTKKMQDTITGVKQ